MSFKRTLHIVYVFLFILTVIGVLSNSSMAATFGVETSGTLWMVWALIGFALLIVEIFVDGVADSGMKKEVTRLQRENTDIKAKLYDDLTKITDQDETIVIKSDTPGTRRKPLL